MLTYWLTAELTRRGTTCSDRGGRIGPNVRLSITIILRLGLYKYNYTPILTPPTGFPLKSVLRSVETATSLWVACSMRAACLVTLKARTVAEFRRSWKKPDDTACRRRPSYILSLPRATENWPHSVASSLSAFWLSSDKLDRAATCRSCSQYVCSNVCQTARHCFFPVKIGRAD
jgi:hypothetical protein